MSEQPVVAEPNKRLVPTRESEALLLAAQPERSAKTREPRIMTRRTVATILSASLLLALQTGASSSASAATEDTRVDSFACPVTLVNGGKGGTFGNESLAVILWDKNGIIFAPDGPGFIDRDGALGMKLGWELRKRGTLFVTGRRLDGDAPPARRTSPTATMTT
jgi:hypothetical protein